MRSGKKKILIFIDWFLPGDKAGGPVRSCVNLIDHLQNEFSFSVVTRDTDYTEITPYSGIQSDAWNEHDGKRVYYISPGKLNRKTIERLIAEEKPDIIYLNGIWSQPFTAWPLQGAKKYPLVKVIVAARGMLAPAALAIKPFKKKTYLLLSKLRNDFSDVLFHATNEKEAGEIKQAFGQEAKVHVAENLSRKASGSFSHAVKQKGKLRLVNIARVAPEKNTLFALETLAGVMCDVEADFYGAVYDKAYEQLCNETMKKLPANVKVKFHGPLPSANIFSTISSYDLLFMPTRGENFGHVILEAMQSGTPVLISDQTPWKDLAAAHAGWDFSLSAQERFLKKIDELCGMGEEEFREWREGAVALAAKYAGDEKVVGNSRELFAGE